MLKEEDSRVGYVLREVVAQPRRPCGPAGACVVGAALASRIQAVDGNDVAYC